MMRILFLLNLFFLDCSCPKSKDPKVPDTYCAPVAGDCKCYDLNGKHFRFDAIKGACVPQGL